MRLLKPLTWTIAGLSLCYGLWYALSNAWLCDDAFISFRYVENLAEGKGLVYNEGERVEGYTNFLWVVLLWLFDEVFADGGVGVMLSSQYLGVACWVATFAILSGAAWRAKALPLAAIGFAVHGHAALFATCGLETLMFTFFVTAGLILLIDAEKPLPYGLAGLALILATMTRPDGALFYALASAVVAWIAFRQRRIGVLVAFALPFVLVYAPYFAWKFSYYGYPFPNTAYAKSASDPYVGQGLWYLWLYFCGYWFLIPALFVPLWLVVRRPGCVVVPGLEARRGPLMIALFTLPFLGYVAWVGGDFMFSRFCLPVTPALFLGLQYLVGSGPQKAILLPVVLLASVLTNHTGASVYDAYVIPSIRPGNPRNVVDEKEHYPQWYVDAHRILGETLSERTRGCDLRVAVGGGQAMLAYFGRFSYVLELNGLTDEFIAHRELTSRGRLGHEKVLPLDHDYIREQRVHLIVGAYQDVGVPGDTPRMAAARRFGFWVENVPFLPKGEPHTGFARATILTHDPAFEAALKGRPGLEFTPFPEFLDGYLPEMGKLGKVEVARDLVCFRRFYFDHVDDVVRLRVIEAFLE